MENKTKVEEVTTQKIDQKEKKEIKEKIIYTEFRSNRKFKFYEILRERIVGFMKNRTGQTGGKLAEYLFTLPDFFILLTRLAVDKRINSNQKIFIGAIIAYIVLPIDFIPDFIPVLGYIDDLVLAVYGLNMILNEIDKKILIENWSGEEDILNLLQKITSTSEQFLNKNVLNKIKRWVRKRSQ